MDRLIVPGTMDSLEAIAEFAAQAAAAADLDENTTYGLHLAVEEIATNIIAHGYARMDGEGVLELSVAIDEKTLTLCIEDTGLTYNPLQYQRPADLDLPPDQRQIGGLGVFLAMRSVDKFLYERVGNRNRHILIVSRD